MAADLAPHNCRLETAGVIWSPSWPNFSFPFPKMGIITYHCSCLGKTDWGGSFLVAWQVDCRYLGQVRRRGSQRGCVWEHGPGKPNVKGPSFFWPLGRRQRVCFFPVNAGLSQ